MMKDERDLKAVNTVNFEPEAPWLLINANDPISYESTDSNVEITGAKYRQDKT